MKNIMRVFVNLIVLFLIACLPSSFQTKHFSLFNYFIAMTEIARALLNPNRIIFVNQKSGVEHSLLPFIFEPWLNSLVILFSVIFISFILSLLLVYLMYRYKICETVIKSINNFLSIIPDIFYIPVSITIIILIYKYTGTLLFQIATSHSSKAIVFPILVLLIIPIVNSISLLYELIKDEKKSMYVEFARAKGLDEFEIFFKHIVFNLIIGYLINLRQIVWITLSSLLFLERIMNIFGISVFIFEYNSPVVLFVTFILLYIPMTVLFSLCNYTVNRITGRRIIE